MNLKLNLKKINIMILFILVFNTLISGLTIKQAKADEITLGVSPSIFKDVKIKRGDKMKFTVNVINNSTFPKKDMSVKYNLYTFDVNGKVKSDIKGDKLTKEENKQINPQTWVSLSKNSFKLRPGEGQDVDINIDVPSNANIGENIVIVSITRNIVKGVEDKKNTVLIPELKIPIYLTVLDEKGNFNAKPSYKIGDSDISTDKFKLNDKAENGFKDIATDILKFIASFFTFDIDKIKDNIDMLLYKSYKINFKGQILYDISFDNKTTLNNVYTSGNINDRKYIYVPKDIDLSKKIKKIETGDTNLMITLEDGKSVDMNFKSAEMLADVKEQVNVLMNNMQYSSTLEWLMSKIRVTKNIKFDNTKVYFLTNISNTGNVTLFPQGNLEVINGNNKVIDRVLLQETVVPVGENKNLTGTILLDNKYTKGSYSVKGVVYVVKDEKPKDYNFDFQIVSYRKYIIASAIISVLLTFGGIFFGIYKALKFRKKLKLKKAKQLNNIENSNIENTQSTENNVDVENNIDIKNKGNEEQDNNK